MASSDDTSLPRFDTISLARKGRLLRISLNRADVLNAVNEQMGYQVVEQLLEVQKKL